MKRCPTCNLKYDDTLSFCLEDGTSLVDFNEPAETVVLPYARVRPYLPPVPGSSVLTSKRSSNRLLYGIILVLALFATGVSVALFYVRDKRSGNVQLEPTPPSATASQTPSQQSPPSPTPAQTATNRYTVTSCNAIQDTHTNLEWFVGPDHNTSWYEAREWATTLQTCGGGWRLPSLEEIRTLYDPGSSAGTGYYTGGQYWPAHMDPVFNHIGGGSWIWSDKLTGDGNAKSFNMNQGKVVEYSAEDTVFSTRVFAVRRTRG